MIFMQSEKNVCYFLLVINSNLGIISHFFEIWPAYRRKTHIFSTPFYSAPNLKMFSLHCIPQIL